MDSSLKSLQLSLQYARSGGDSLQPLQQQAFTELGNAYMQQYDMMLSSVTADGASKALGRALEAYHDALAKASNGAQRGYTTYTINIATHFILFTLTYSTCLCRYALHNIGMVQYEKDKGLSLQSYNLALDEFDKLDREEGLTPELEVQKGR